LSFSLMVVITKKARRVNAVVLTFLLGVTLFVVSGSLLIMSG
jgi:heme/copper-type cytochrome/quinol oxidase subunit 4